MEEDPAGVEVGDGFGCSEHPVVTASCSSGEASGLELTLSHAVSQFGCGMLERACSVRNREANYYAG